MSMLLMAQPAGGWLELFAREHPAFVHFPIAASILLPVALLLSLRPQGEPWLRTARFLGWVALLGALPALASGFLWARGLDLIAPGAWVPHPAPDGPAQVGLLLIHQRLAILGFILALPTVALLSLSSANGTRRRWGILVLALGWSVLWGAAGHWGGQMVFPSAPSSPIPSVAVISSVGQPPTPTLDLKAFFSNSCAQCHGQDGSGFSSQGIRLMGRNLTNPAWQQRVSDARLVHSIRYGKGIMPPFGQQLSEAEALLLVQEVVRPLARGGVRP